MGTYRTYLPFSMVKNGNGDVKRYECYEASKQANKLSTSAQGIKVLIPTQSLTQTRAFAFAVAYLYKSSKLRKLSAVRTVPTVPTYLPNLACLVDGGEWEWGWGWGSETT